MMHYYYHVNSLKMKVNKISIIEKRFQHIIIHILIQIWKKLITQILILL